MPAGAPSASAPKLEVVDLHKSFGPKQVLVGVSVAAKDGESLVILGASGSGKSVLLKHFIGLLKPERGQVRVGGRDMTGATGADWIEVRRKCGMSFQEGALFDSMNVFENIAFPLRRHTKMSEAQIADRVRECLDMVQLDGVETKATSQLSGGMRRRVGFARAIAMKPEILLFDEPHSGLDPITTATLDRDIVAMRQRMNPTLLTITHDVRAGFRIADRFVVLRHGRIQFDGSPDELERSEDAFIRSFLAGEPFDDEGGSP
jgi:phospholipid/cholesterol/gamma-HCH transport system ATP-binding protein